MARLLKVQKQIERMAELDLGDTRRFRIENSAAMTELVDAMSSSSPAHQAFSDLYAAKLGSLAAQEQRLGVIESIQEKRVLQETAKSDRLESNMQSVRVSEGRETEENEILDLLELALQATQGSGKLHSS